MSRLKSAAAAKPAKGAKPAARPARTAQAGGGGTRGVYVQAPKSDVYVVMLGIALGAIVLACLLLLWLWYGYNMQMTPTVWFAPSNATPSSLGSAVPSLGLAPLAS